MDGFPWSIDLLHWMCPARSCCQYTYDDHRSLGKSRPNEPSSEAFADGLFQQIAGIAIGQLSTLVPMYCGEIAPAQHRGKLSGMLQVMLSWGFFIAQWLGYGCFKVDSAFQWRFPLLFQVIPPVIMMLGIPWLPESPRWLVERERYDEAQTVLKRLRSGNTEERLINLEFLEIRETIIAEKQVTVTSWKEIFSRPAWRKRLILGMGLQAFSQLSGVNVM
jgi:MFS family permease